MAVNLYEQPDYGSTDAKPARVLHEDRLKEGDLVQCIIYQKDYIPKYKKLVDKRNSTQAEKLQKMGMEMDNWEEYTYKTCGLAYRCLVLRRSESIDDMGKITWQPLFTNVVEVDYNVEFQLLQPTPGQMFLDKGFGAAKYRTGWCLKSKNGFPEIESRMFPPAYPVKDWESGVTADAIPEGQAHKYDMLIEKERQRVTQWEMLIEDFSKLTDKEMKIRLDGRLAQRMMWLKESFNDYGYELILPRVGLVFQGKVKAWKDSEMFDVVSCELAKEGNEWHSYNYQMPVNEPSDTDVEVAMNCFDMWQQKQVQLEEENKPGF